MQMLTIELYHRVVSFVFPSSLVNFHSCGGLLEKMVCYHFEEAFWGLNLSGTHLVKLTDLGGFAFSVARRSKSYIYTSKMGFG